VKETVLDSQLVLEQGAKGYRLVDRWAPVKRSDPMEPTILTGILLDMEILLERVMVLAIRWDLKMD
jgi:hypothetical protein